VYFKREKELLLTEFRNRYPNEVYKLAFSRLLKPDPFRIISKEPNLLMLGTDERDLFVPFVRSRLERHEGCAELLDIGCSNGETTLLFADLLERGSAISYIDVNDAYLAQYHDTFSSMPGIKLKRGLKCDIDTLTIYSDDKTFDGNAFDVILSQHSIYFVSNLRGFLNWCLNKLRDGGSIFLVFADEAAGYTGRSVATFLEERDQVELERFRRRIELRHRVFSIVDSCVDCKSSEISIRRFLDRHDFTLASAVYQRSKLYGHTLSDIIALAFITALPWLEKYDITGKVDHVAKMISANPEFVSLSVELDGERKRMYSVIEPQVCLQITRKAS